MVIATTIIAVAAVFFIVDVGKWLGGFSTAKPPEYLSALTKQEVPKGRDPPQNYSNANYLEEDFHLTATKADQTLDLISQPCNILDRPEPIRNPSLHRGCDPQALMDADKVVMHEVDRNRVNVILDPP